ncbi:MAG: hypothetical protein PHV48_01485 [Candidatus Omnitrophica bacterium]|nr:hypothetical protein [Candidatus Omnitrophota bacterium]
MLIYMAIPILIMVGLCVFFYMAGRYVHIGKKWAEISASKINKTQELPKEPGRVPILEEEIRNLKKALEIKDKELEERNKAAESIMRENQKLLAEARRENMDKTAGRKEEAEDAVKPEIGMPQLENTPPVNDIAASPVSLSDEDSLKESGEKAEEKKPEKKIKRKKPKNKIKRKPSKK